LPEKPGAVKIVPDPAAQAMLASTGPAGVDFSEWGGFANQRSIITGVGLRQLVNYQMMPTLGRDVYLYVFGNQPGDMMISGLAFAASCDFPQPFTGIDRVLAYYRNQRATSRRSLVEIAIARTAFRGILIGMESRIEDPGSNLFSFVLNLKLVPEADVAVNSGSGSGSSSDGTDPEPPTISSEQSFDTFVHQENRSRAA
jgi:hypothetical protein